MSQIVDETFDSGLLNALQELATAPKVMYDYLYGEVIHESHAVDCPCERCRLCYNRNY